MYRINEQILAFFRSSALRLQVFALMVFFLLAALASAQETKVSVKGTIRDQSGASVSGATIQFEYSRMGDDIEQKSVTCQSDEHGRYEFPEVSLSSDENRFHVVRVARAGFAFAGSILSSVEYKGSKKIATDGKTTIDFSLEPSTKVEIRLCSSDGHPVADAVLASLTFKNPLGLAVLQPSHWKTLGLEVPTSNQDGVMKIDCLTSHDSNNCGIDHPDFARSNLWNVIPNGEQQIATLESGEPVTFKVACVSNPAAIRDAKVNLTISEEGGHSFVALDVDDQGTCKARLADRHTTITVKHPTLVGVPFYNYQPKPNQEYKFELFETAKVQGRVVNKETREGVEGVQVMLAHTNATISYASSDKLGKFELSGPATVVAINVAFGQSQFDAVGEPVKTTLDSSTTTVLPDLVVAERKPIRGKVVLPSGAPAANVLLVANLRDAAVRTDAEGKFEVRPSGYAARGVPLMALHPHEELACLVVADQEAQDVLLELAPEGNLYGVVVDSNNNPLPNFRVNLSAQIGLSRGAQLSTTLGNTYTQADGTFVFAGLSKGVVYQAAIQGKQKSSFFFAIQSKKQRV